MTQWFNETVGDWTQQIKIDSEQLDILCNFEFKWSKSSTAFKELVKRKALSKKNIDSDTNETFKNGQPVL